MRQATFSASLGPIVLGGNVFGWTVSEKEAFPLLDAYVDKGGRAIDTADLYPSWAPGCVGGESETIIGKWIASRKNRDRIVLATKVAKWDQHPGLSPENIRSAIDDSLARLQTDYVDIYYAHQDDPKTDQTAYLEALDGVVRAGKARVIGASNFTPDRFSSALAISKKNGWTSFAISQDEWNLVERDIEKGLAPLLEKESIPEVPYFSLASGFLTGKYGPGTKIDSKRADGVKDYVDDPKNRKLLDVMNELARRENVSVSAIALEWLRAQSIVLAPIASARTIEQLDALFERPKLSVADVTRLSDARGV